MSKLAHLSTLGRRALVCSLFGALSLPAWSQSSGGDTLRLVVPFGAGTTTDIVSRQVGDAMSSTLGLTLVIENRAGGGGSVGTALVAKAAGDGRTLLMGTVGTHAINPTLFRKLPYDALNDFVPIGLVGFTPTLLVVAAGSSIKTLDDLRAQAAKGQGITFGSAGNGTSGHLAGELLKARLGGQMVHAPYSQGGQALTDVIAGQTQFMFYHPAAVMPHVNGGKLRALAASSAKRSVAAPGVPTLMEQGVADFDLVAWFMLYAPASTSSADVTRLRAALQVALAKPEVAAKLVSLGVEPRAVPASELLAFNQSEIQRWAEAVKRSGAQVD
jgi:tripartite-type tricarboxylate transporter receptor subunit TctC